MRSRRLPGSRDIDRPAPVARPQAPTLFDGETIVRKTPVAARAPSAPPQSQPFAVGFGTRSLLVAAVFVQVVGAMWFAPRLVLALEYLSQHTGNLVPLAGLGALASGLLGWSWWFRQWSVAVAFCVCAALWWAMFVGPVL